MAPDEKERITKELKNMWPTKGNVRLFFIVKHLTEEYPPEIQEAALNHLVELLKFTRKNKLNQFIRLIDNIEVILKLNGDHDTILKTNLLKALKSAGIYDIL